MFISGGYSGTRLNHMNHLGYRQMWWMRRLLVVRVWFLVLSLGVWHELVTRLGVWWLGVYGMVMV